MPERNRFFRTEDGSHGDSHGQQKSSASERHRTRACRDSTTSAGPSEGMAKGVARKPGRVRQPGKRNSSRLRADGRSRRVRAIGSGNGACRVRRRREKKVVPVDPKRKFRAGEPRPLKVRLLGGLLIYVTTLYCSPARRTGDGRGKEGSGL